MFKNREGGLRWMKHACFVAFMVALSQMGASDRVGYETNAIPDDVMFDELDEDYFMSAPKMEREKIEKELAYLNFRRGHLLDRKSRISNLSSEDLSNKHGEVADAAWFTVFKTFIYNAANDVVKKVGNDAVENILKRNLPSFIEEFMSDLKRLNNENPGLASEAVNKLVDGIEATRDPENVLNFDPKALPIGYERELALYARQNGSKFYNFWGSLKQLLKTSKGKVAVVRSEKTKFKIDDMVKVCRSFVDNFDKFWKEKTHQLNFKGDFDTSLGRANPDVDNDVDQYFFGNVYRFCFINLLNRASTVGGISFDKAGFDKVNEILTNLLDFAKHILNNQDEIAYNPELLIKVKEFFDSSGPFLQSASDLFVLMFEPLSTVLADDRLKALLPVNVLKFAEKVPLGNRSLYSLSELFRMSLVHGVGNVVDINTGKLLGLFEQFPEYWARLQLKLSDHITDLRQKFINYYAAILGADAAPVKEVKAANQLIAANDDTYGIFELMFFQSRLHSLGLEYIVSNPYSLEHTTYIRDADPNNRPSQLYDFISKVYHLKIRHSTASVFALRQDNFWDKLENVLAGGNATDELKKRLAQLDKKDLFQLFVKFRGTRAAVDKSDLNVGDFSYTNAGNNNFYDYFYKNLVDDDPDHGILNNFNVFPVSSAGTSLNVFRQGGYHATNDRTLLANGSITDVNLIDQTNAGRYSFKADPPQYNKSSVETVNNDVGAGTTDKLVAFLRYINAVKAFTTKFKPLLVPLLAERFLRVPFFDYEKSGGRDLTFDDFKRGETKNLYDNDSGWYFVDLKYVGGRDGADFGVFFERIFSEDMGLCYYAPANKYAYSVNLKDYIADFKSNDPNYVTRFDSSLLGSMRKFFHSYLPELMFAKNFDGKSTVFGGFHASDFESTGPDESDKNWGGLAEEFKDFGDSSKKMAASKSREKNSLKEKALQRRQLYDFWNIRSSDLTANPEQKSILEDVVEPPVESVELGKLHGILDDFGSVYTRRDHDESEQNLVDVKVREKNGGLKHVGQASSSNIDYSSEDTKKKSAIEAVRPAEGVVEKVYYRDDKGRRHYLGKNSIVDEPVAAKSKQEEKPYRPVGLAGIVDEPVAVEKPKQEYKPYRPVGLAGIVDEPVAAEKPKQEYKPYRPVGLAGIVDEPVAAEKPKQEYKPYRPVGLAGIVDEPVAAEKPKQEYKPYRPVGLAGIVDEPVAVEKPKQEYKPYRPVGLAGIVDEPAYRYSDRGFDSSLPEPSKEYGLFGMI